MPIISRFFGIAIRIHWKDHNPPHFHAYYEKYKSIFDIKTGEKMEGKFPRTGERIVKAWARQHQKELFKSWEQARQGQQPNTIPGAE